VSISCKPYTLIRQLGISLPNHINLYKMTDDQKKDAIVKLLAKAMFYGDWKWETPTERVMTMLMTELGFYPINNESQMIDITQVDKSLYERAKREVNI